MTSIPEKLANCIGLPDLAAMDDEEFRGDFTVASFIGLSDGDIYAAHRPYEGEQAERYGESAYSQGSVAKAMLKAAIEQGVAPGLLRAYQSEVARLALSSGMLPDASSAVHIGAEALLVDGNLFGLEQKDERRVLDLTACSHVGRSMIEDQVSMLAQDQLPFRYLPIGRTHFTDNLLFNSYNYHSDSDDLARFMVDNKFYVGREDGLPNAVDVFLAGQKALGGTPVIDIMMATQTEHASREGLLHAIGLAPQLLVDGGMLILRAPVEPVRGGLTIGELSDTAFAAGFKEETAIRHDSQDPDIVTTYITGKPASLAFTSVVLTNA